MKTIGMIGGMSWESSAEYYRIINETVKKQLGGLHSAKCILYSLEFEEIEQLQHAGDWAALEDSMVDAAQKLKGSGADFIVICTNTMHKLAPAIEKRAGVKLLHIAAVAGEKIVQQKLKKVALFGTKFTMEQDFYKRVLSETCHLDVMIPNPDEREMIHGVIYRELCQGQMKAESREKIKAVIRRLSGAGAEAIVLGCTELPLLIKQVDSEIPVFDTTELHAIAAAAYALEK